VSITQILRGAPATLSAVFRDQYGSARTAGAVTVTITRADGTALLTNAVTNNGTDPGTKEVQLSAIATNVLDRLHCVWQELNGQTVEQFVEVVGGYYFSIDEARQAGPGFEDSAKYPDALVLRARANVEQWIESPKVTGRAFVPRFATAVLDGDDRQSLVLPNPDVRRIRSLSVSSGSMPYVGDQDALDALQVDGVGRLYAPLYGFPYGVRNVEVAYEFGLDAPPARIKSAALYLVREVLKYTKTGAPDSATWQMIDGRVFGISQPGQRGSRTGIPHVDEALDEWAFSRGSAASVPYG
jgi:hypothetical protein